MILFTDGNLWAIFIVFSKGLQVTKHLDGPHADCMLPGSNASSVFFKTDEAYEHGRVTLFKL